MSTGTTCGLKFFSKFLNRFGFSAETFGMVLKILSACPKWNLRKKYFLLFFLSEFFRISSEKFFRLLAKKLQELVKNNFYVSRGTICGLKFFFSFESFRIFCRNLWHGSSKIYLSVQSKKCGRNSSFVFLFRLFFEFWAKFFQTFGRKTSKICENYLLRVHTNNLWL